MDLDRSFANAEPGRYLLVEEGGHDEIDHGSPTRREGSQAGADLRRFSVRGAAFAILSRDLAADHGLPGGREAAWVDRFYALSIHHQGLIHSPTPSRDHPSRQRGLDIGADIEDARLRAGFPRLRLFER